MHPDHHPTQNFDPHHSRQVPGPVEATPASKIEKHIEEIEQIIEGVSSRIIKIGSIWVHIAPYGPVSGQDEAYHLQEAF